MNTTPGPTVTLFVYGTLRRGFWNHARFCRNALNIRPASTWGRLYLLPAGYPALEIPESAILAHGTADPLADAAAQARLTESVPPPGAGSPPAGDWDLIHGELMTFPDPALELPPIDQLEGFRPGEDSFYRRELAWVSTGCGQVPAWLYVADLVLAGTHAVRISAFRCSPAARPNAENACSTSHGARWYDPPRGIR